MTPHARRGLQTLAVAMCTLGAYGPCSGDFAPDRSCPSYDIDCDQISNVVESNFRNAHHGFRNGTVDKDPSRALKTPQDGTLQGGINLVNPFGGINTGNPIAGSVDAMGYYHYCGTDGCDADDWGTLMLINVIESVGRSWWVLVQHHPDACWYPEDDLPFGAGDMSLQNGGPFLPDHPLSHRNGRDVDVRYLRNDGVWGENATLDIWLNPGLWNVQTSIDLLQCFIENPDVELILVSPEIYSIVFPPLRKLMIASGHDNHFHVRIWDPDGLGN